MSNVEFFKDQAGEWRWRVRAGNHEVVASSEGYTRRRDAVRGFETALAAIQEAGIAYSQPIVVNVSADGDAISRAVREP